MRVIRSSYIKQKMLAITAVIVLLALGSGMQSQAAEVTPTIAAADALGFGIDRSGTLVSWGNDWFGQLGIGRRVIELTPQKVGDGYVPLAGEAGNQRISTDNSSVIAIKADGTLQSWGRNDFGQLGDGSYNDKSRPQGISSGFVSVATTQTQSFALKPDHSLWQISGGAIRPFAQDYVSVAGALNLTAGIKADGSLWVWGNMNAYCGAGFREFGGTPVQLGSGFSSISVGPGHVLALKQDGSLLAMGCNDNGQLGDGSHTSQADFVLIEGKFKSVFAGGGRWSAALDADGSLWGWGFGFGDIPKKIDTGYAAIGGGYDLLALRIDGALTQISLPYQNRKQISGNYKAVIQGTVGNYLAVQADGSLWSWGNDLAGELGIGAITSRATPSVVGGNYQTISSSGNTAVAVKTDGTLWKWGALQSSIPVQQEGTGYANSLIGNSGQILALKADHTLWAINASIGDGTSINYYVPKLITGEVRDFAVGAKHYLAVKQDGSLWGWGGNNYGQLGDGSATERLNLTKLGEGYASVAAYDNHSLAIKQDGSVWAWGHNDNGQLGDGSKIDRLRPVKIADGFSKIRSGYAHTIGLKPDGSIWLWGSGYSGQLGDRLGQQVLIPTRFGEGFIDVAVGDFHSMALRSDGTVQAWGSNLSGDLGNGTYLNSSTPVYVVNSSATDLLDLDVAKPNAIDFDKLYAYYLTTTNLGNSLSASITDNRANGLTGDVYFSALLPANSPLLPKANGFADATVGTIPVTLGRGGVKQTGPGIAGAPAASGTGTISTGNSFAVYDKVNDPLKGTNAIICMGITTPELSAKGQVLMRPIANGDKSTGVAQCPTVQTAATSSIYRGTTTGSISKLGITASITPQAEDRGQQRYVYSWAIAPDGTQFMQTGPNQWALMQDPMLPATSVTVPASGDVSLSVIDGLDLSTLRGTLVYVGMGSSWAEVKLFNKAGHYYTVN